MRLLHVGSGFRPLRRGGITAYAEDLMDEQVRGGHAVSYFFSGRQYPLMSRPRLRRWEQRGVAMLEVVNSPLYDHGRQPELEILAPAVDRMLEEALRRVRPDAVHVHELAGLPFSVLDVIDAARVPVVFTLQDYFPICSTFRLLDAGGNVCTRLEIGADCMATTAADPRDPGLMVEATLKLYLRQAPLVRRWALGRGRGSVHRLTTRVAAADAARRWRRDGSPPATPASFQRRRKLNVERLNRIDRVLAMSTRVAAIYERLGVDPGRLRTVHLTLAHIEALTPRRADGGIPVTFASLAAFESESKGALLLIDAVRRLADMVPPGSFRLLVAGHVDPRFARLADGVPGIEVGTTFRPDELDAILDGVDVGIVPSVWEEAYAYAGIEFLAKGVPVIANAIGGMPDYTREGETGWLNRSLSAEELAEIMARVVERPDEVVKLNSNLIERRTEIVKPLARHADEIEAVYREAISARRG